MYLYTYTYIYISGRELGLTMRTPSPKPQAQLLPYPLNRKLRTAIGGFAWLLSLIQESTGPFDFG